jgi:hypothetical protein
MPRNILRADFQLNGCECGMNHEHHELLESKAICAGKDPHQKTMACLRLNWSWPGYIKNLKSNGLNPKRVVKKCKHFIVRPFDPQLYEHDFMDIVESRSPVKFYSDINACIQSDYPCMDCRCHWRMWWGIFEPDRISIDKKAYPAQVGVNTGKLVAFASLHRLGDFVRYKNVNGHRDYLQGGILNKLHFGIMKNLLNKEEDFYKGLQFLIYDAFFDSKKGVLRWKKKMLFRPMKIKLHKKESIYQYES